MHDDGYFDEPVAERYDESSDEMFDSAAVDPVVDFLVELAGDGRALELGTGTGRIALPLARRGVPVHGIDEYDVARQGLISHHFQLVDGKIDRSSGPFRYVWPSELDLIAELAGMQLRERWGGWKREPFTSDSRKHVSVWQKPTA